MSPSQLSEAVAVPKAVLIASAVGLQPKSEFAFAAVMTGIVKSILYVTVTLFSTAALPQASITFHVRVTDQKQPLVFTGSPVVTIGVSAPSQLSCAVAVPKAVLMASAVGLQPRSAFVFAAVITGGVLSTT